VIFNWIATGANMAVGFFLAPFIVHRLGNVAYGVWVLAISAVTYLGLLDLGMQSSVLRFVSKGHTQGDHAGASDAISAAFWVRIQIAGLVVLLSAVLAAVFPLFFKVPPDLASDARKAVLLIGATTALTMAVGVLGGVLSALNRYDLHSYISLTQMAIRVVGVVAVLRTGHGIVAIAACEFAAAAVGNLLLVLIARRLYPQLQVRFAKPKREVLRQIWSYSFYVFMTTIAMQLVYQTDNLVVGAFVSASAVTFYAIGNSLCRYAGQIVGSMTQTFVPAASTYEAAGDIVSLRALYFNGTRATMAVALPILVTLMIRGRSFIALWMGPAYSQKSGTVLMILATALFFSYANRTAGAISYGVEKHKAQAICAIAEGVTNLALSITLVHWFGIYGVAIGTLVPSLIVQLGFWPQYVSRLVAVSSFQVVWKVWGPMYLAAIPFAVASYAMNLFFPARNLTMFFLQLLSTLPIFIITMILCFWKTVRGRILPRMRARFFAEAS
jgi:O-antigen/teichoic acid export membrane protein